MQFLFDQDLLSKDVIIVYIYLSFLFNTNVLIQLFTTSSKVDIKSFLFFSDGGWQLLVPEGIIISLASHMMYNIHC